MLSKWPTGRRVAVTTVSEPRAVSPVYYFSSARDITTR